MVFGTGVSICFLKKEKKKKKALGQITGKNYALWNSGNVLFSSEHSVSARIGSDFPAGRWTPRFEFLCIYNLMKKSGKVPALSLLF